MRARERRALERTAYHEAGHAVAAYALRKRVSSVTIVPDTESGTLGLVIHGGLGRAVDRYSVGDRPGIQCDLRTERALERTIMIRCAGFIAEARFAGRRNWVGSRQDRLDVLDMAEIVTGADPAASSAYVAWLEQRAAWIVGCPPYWAAIQGLAAVLLERRELRGLAPRRVIVAAIEAWQEREAPEIAALMRRQAQAARRAR